MARYIGDSLEDWIIQERPSRHTFSRVELFHWLTTETRCQGRHSFQFKMNDRSSGVTDIINLWKMEKSRGAHFRLEV